MFWKQHIPYLSDIAKPIYKVTRKAVNFQWNKEQKEAFQQLKHYIHLFSQLQNIQPGDKVVLDIAFISEHGNWGLYKKGKDDHKLMPVGFWSKKFPYSHFKYSYFEKLIWTLYAALLHTEPLTGQQPITVRSTLPLKAWLNMSAEELAGNQIEEKVLAWKWYINTRCISGSGEPALLTEEVNKLEVEPPTCANKFEPIETSIGVQGPKYTPVFKNAWFTDGSAPVSGDRNTWRAAAFIPATQQALTVSGESNSAQHAELIAAYMAIQEAVRTQKQNIYIYRLLGSI